jgi:hypothetical protein
MRGNIGVIAVWPIMHICLVGNNRTPVQGNWAEEYVYKC